MSKKLNIFTINGPNLNMLGMREPDIYGHETLADIEKRCRSICDADGATLEWMQSNSEGEIITAVQQAAGRADWIVINAAGLTHSSVALRDALALFPGGKIEIHLSNTHKREEFRHHSMISAVVNGVVLGFGSMSYVMAIRGILEITRES
ncbi:type II 3-dehydroquinate dehydratase [Alphaproteobacteria bacterium]|jgi:3-dehydroquinate dehydratase-2|nr:type II 3-dehydroquinate dehydratase [Alphaproteobacteria bacterium]